MSLIVFIYSVRPGPYHQYQAFGNTGFPVFCYVIIEGDDLVVSANNRVIMFGTNF